jgi:transcriptional regulator with XRE-family HTH domain
MSKDIADYIGIRRSSVSEFENGITAPSLASLLALADLFGVSLDYLCGRSESRERLP